MDFRVVQSTKRQERRYFKREGFLIRLKGLSAKPAAALEEANQIERKKNSRSAPTDSLGMKDVGWNEYMREEKRRKRKRKEKKKKKTRRARNRMPLNPQSGRGEEEVVGWVP